METYITCYVQERHKCWKEKKRETKAMKDREREKANLPEWSLTGALGW
jgi:hypothetical protein